MPGLIGKKIGMTSVFNDEGKQEACTIVEVGPCAVTQVKTEDKDGYNAVQLAFGTRKDKATPAALKGHFYKAGVEPKAKVMEFVDMPEDTKVGDELDVSLFEEGEYVHVSGTSKGKGFQGVVRRHNFSGVGDMTHGQHNRQRHPGSLGGSSDPSRVFKGMKMGGQTGDASVTVQNLKVAKVLPEQNIILVTGAVPGAKGAYVILRK